MPARFEGVYNLDYKAPPTVRDFQRSKAFVRGLRGPFGSGKSTGCCHEIFRRLNQQAPWESDGIRRSRWAVIRNTYPELETTTIKTWLYWFPETIFGKFYRKIPYRHEIAFNDVEAEIYFMSADSDDDMKKLASLELTGLWVNEARFIPKAIIDAGIDRVGRYPPMREGGPTWHGVIMDTNSPPAGHWWQFAAGDAEYPDDWEPVDDWEFFAQPPAVFKSLEGGHVTWEVNPDAENIENLPKNYYKKGIQGKTMAYITVFYANEYGDVEDGKKVYEKEWNEAVHYYRDYIRYVPGRTVIVGLDFGRSPAACYSMKDAKGRWFDFDEIAEEQMGAERFAQILKAKEAEFPRGTKFRYWGDPQGEHPTESSERSYFDILAAKGIKVKGAPTQDPVLRREAGARPMTRLIDGQPGYLLSKKCSVLHRGFQSKFRYPKIGKTAPTDVEQRYSEAPEKNYWSHVHEARQYAYAGEGEVKDLLDKQEEDRWRKRGSFRVKTGWNPLQQGGGSSSRNAFRRHKGGGARR